MMKMPALTVMCRALVVLLSAAVAGCTTVNNNNINANTQRQTNQQVQVEAEGAVRAGEGVGATPAAGRPRVTPEDLGTPLAELHRNFTGKIMLAGRLMPLPEGEWYLAARGVGHGRGNDINETLLLLRQSGPSLSGLAMYTANPLAKPSSGYRLFPSCADSNYLFADVRTAAPDGRQDCFSIQFVSEAALRAPRAGPLVKALVDAANARNLAIPETMLVASFVEAEPTHVVVFTLYLNPDLAGVPPAPSVVRAESDWASFNLQRDPARAAYVQRLQAWGQAWRIALLDAFEGRGIHVSPEAAATP